MIKAIIVDDEEASINVIQTLSRQFSNEIEIVATASNTTDAAKSIVKHEPDIVFLDIELGDALSFEILEQLPGLQAHVIFITAYEHYAIKAIKFHAYEYILKPVMPEELFDTLGRVMADIKKKNETPDIQQLINHLKYDTIKKIAVPSKNGLHYYAIENIVCIEGEGSYVKMHLADKKPVTITRRVKDFEDCLAAKGFVRVHKSFLVNINHILELHKDEGGYLLMTNNLQVPMRTRERDEIIKLIKDSSYLI